MILTLRTGLSTELVRRVLDEIRRLGFSPHPVPHDTSPSACRVVVPGGHASFDVLREVEGVEELGRVLAYTRSQAARRDGPTRSSTSEAPRSAAAISP